MQLKIGGKTVAGASGSDVEIPNEVVCELLTGGVRKLPYQNMDNTGKEFAASVCFQEAGCRISVEDRFADDGGEILVTRKIQGRAEQQTGQGAAFPMEFRFMEKGGKWRFCIPTLVYTKPEGLKPFHQEFMEDRLPGNLVFAYQQDGKTGFALTKEAVSQKTEAPQREKGVSRYLHQTENASLGIAAEKGSFRFLARWPYQEKETSVALDAGGTPAVAFYPLDGDFSVTLQYRLSERVCGSFSEGVCFEYAGLAERLEKSGQKLVELPFSVEDSMRYRLESLGKSYQEFGRDGAGFFFHFDPRKGYGSLPSGFGTSFNTIPHTSYVHILEYGFTGRQMNAALLMAEHFGGEWKKRGEKVVDFFLKKCTAPNGWMYSLYDLNTDAPFFSFGDKDAPKLHYISRTDDKGNYLRTMAEPSYDILKCYQWYRTHGTDRPDWLDSSERFAKFLVQHQNPDGSWYRGYRPDGSPADMGGTEGLSEEEAEYGKKAATAIPLVFLCELCKELESQGLDAEPYERAAAAAAAYTMKNAILPEHYQGGTLDNPNVVDKEAAQYAMAGMYAMYGLTGKQEYLEAAKQAAYLFVTWNYIWNAPTQPGTYLDGKRFQTKGFGAINSIWGGGVVDIYSLFHIRELYQVGKEAGEPFFCRMAGWCAAAAQQILSCPQDDMTFADIGMQPEGFGVCCQGIDEGMIAKGDIWGTLGWIYSAGIYGVERYLEAKRD